MNKIKFFSIVCVLSITLLSCSKSKFEGNWKSVTNNSTKVSIKKRSGDDFEIINADGKILNGRFIRDCDDSQLEEFMRINYYRTAKECKDYNTKNERIIILNKGYEWIMVLRDNEKKDFKNKPIYENVNIEKELLLWVTALGDYWLLEESR